MSNSMLKGIHRRALGISNEDKVMAPKGFMSGGDDSVSIVHPSPNTAAVFDDFMGDLVGDEWAIVSADTGGDNTGVIVTGTNGILRLTTENAPVNTALAGSVSVSTGTFKQWKADQGPGNPNTSGTLRLAARVKFDSVSRTVQRQHVFVGFTDTGGSEFPAYDTGAGIIGVADDYVGFLFSPGGDTGWSLVAGQGGSDQLNVPGVSPSANTYEDLEVEITHGISDTGGTATFYRNGVAIGSISNPIGSSVALAPKIGFFPQDTGARNLDIDWVNVSAPRDTGV